MTVNPKRSEIFGTKSNCGTACVENFWTDSEPESFCVDISPPDVSAAIIKRLGPPLFWDNRRDFNNMMGKYYDEISKHAVETAYGESSGSGEKKKRKN